jgi:hypothetical protein
VVDGLLLLVGFAIRPAPRTSGIVELAPAERGRYDAAMNRLIEDIEAKYGMRPPRPPEPGEADRSRPLIDAATVRELDSYYSHKRQRDRDRASGGQAAGPLSGSGTPAQRAPSTSPTARRPVPPASPGEP